MHANTPFLLIQHNSNLLLQRHHYELTHPHSDHTHYETTPTDLPELFQLLLHPGSAVQSLLQLLNPLLLLLQGQLVLLALSLVLCYQLRHSGGGAGGVVNVRLK